MPQTVLVIPCYNEAGRLQPSRFSDFLKNHTEVSICFVNDGSTDATENILSELARKFPSQIFILSLEKNSGKAEAIRKGMLHAGAMTRFDFTGFWDADLATPLEELPPMLSFLDSHSSAVMVLGARVKRLGSNIERNALRHILGRVFATFSNWILKVPVYDSQCGAKVFRREIITALFSKPFVTKWIFDVEILVRIRNNPKSHCTINNVHEFPLTQWRDVKGSKLSGMDYFRIPFELWKIYRKYNRE